ncbi:DUF4157 domain-containing protein [Pseudomonas syringae]|uniref:eCIS core domain-containing protein n=1 Tax=Pseudomonas syringae TaxID=317 RepID=UPI000401C1BE|nr:DUF4157 domain-containing protein [Pseudomonas syringae]
MAEFDEPSKKHQNTGHENVYRQQGGAVLQNYRAVQCKAGPLEDNRENSRRGVVLEDNRGSSAKLAQKSSPPNNTGIPDQLKAGIESLSGMSMDHVKVHYNSDKPTQLNAHAYAQGSHIYLASGQEKHLPHEAWHIVQQAQGRVRPTFQMKGGVRVNDDSGLEREADVMGEKALQMRLSRPGSSPGAQVVQTTLSAAVIQKRDDVKAKIKAMTSKAAPSETIQGISMWAYTGGGYKVINSILRSGFSGSYFDSLKKTGLELGVGALVNGSLFAVLDNAFELVVKDSDEKSKTYRGAVHTKAEWMAMKEGGTIKLAGLTSTSKDTDAVGVFDESEVLHVALDDLPSDAKVGGMLTFVDPHGLDIDDNKELGDLEGRNISPEGISMNSGEKELTLPHHAEYMIKENKYSNFNQRAYWEVLLERVIPENELLAESDILKHVETTSPNTADMGYLTNISAAQAIAEETQEMEISTEVKQKALGDKLLGLS